MRVDKWDVDKDSRGAEWYRSREHCWARIRRWGMSIRCARAASPYIVNNHREPQILRVIGLCPKHVPLGGTIGIDGKLYCDPVPQPGEVR